ncbi:MAG: hypothetical protein D6715_04940 [Calditrichaeota bacterium]|nr:MAG: hypothetical protein D6715_04940 [Calditrichota bacterium]
MIIWFPFLLPFSLFKDFALYRSLHALYLATRGLKPYLTALLFEEFAFPQSPLVARALPPKISIRA